MARIHGITKHDQTNTYWGMATTVYFNHCPHLCPGCWNVETQALDESLEVDNDAIVAELLAGLDEYFAEDLTLLGGEPLSPLNKVDVAYIVRKVKEKRPETRILCWTGYRWEVPWVQKHPIIQDIDILIDGRFEESLKVEGHKFGSSNQRVIDVKKSLRTGGACEAPEVFDRNLVYG